HQTLHDVEPESRTVIAAARTGLQTGELLEQPALIGRPESDAAVAHGELDLGARAARAHGDLPAADRSDGVERILDEVADDHIDGKRVREHLQVLRNAGLELDVLLARALLELPDHAPDGARERHGFAFQIDATPREPHAVEDARDHRLHARQVREHALG